MLRHTFCHIPGVGAKTEQRLWASGCTSWDAVPPGRLPAAPLRDSLAHYQHRNPAWFGNLLPASQSWRLYHDFRDTCAFFDIETTGMLGGGHITTIALYDGRSVRHYVHGVNLADFLRDVADHRILVSYNGKSFDVPFLERTFGIRLEQAHIDLRHVLRALGLSGGLKYCERQLGLQRPGMEEVDGYAAVLLWHHFRTWRDPRALESLLAYNVQDAVNLETLMVLAHNRHLAALAAPFAANYRLDVPKPPANPFRVDAALVRRLLAENPAPRF